MPARWVVCIWGDGRAARAHRAWRRALLPLVVRRTRAKRAGHHEGQQRLGVATHTDLMVSSGVERRARRTMGCEGAAADAVLLAQVVGVGAYGGFERHVGAAIGFEALRSLGPVGGWLEDAERYQAMVPAEAAIGFAPQGVVEAGFSVGEQDRDGVEDGSRDVLPAHGCEAAADHEDHQRPEAEHDSHEGGDVSEQPEGKASAFHGDEYTAAGGPAGLVAPIPHFGGLR